MLKLRTLRFKRHPDCAGGSNIITGLGREAIIRRRQQVKEGDKRWSNRSRKLGDGRKVLGARDVGALWKLEKAKD